MPNEIPAELIVCGDMGLNGNLEIGLGLGHNRYYSNQLCFNNKNKHFSPEPVDIFELFTYGFTCFTYT